MRPIQRAAGAERRPKAPWQVWRDAAGRLSPLRIVALLFLLVPVAIAIYDFNTEGFGARPLNNVIHRTGYWALIFLMIVARDHAAAADRALQRCSTCAG
jgi:hypothetical protein